jgi:Flp pilus assembly protein TadD
MNPDDPIGVQTSPIEVVSALLEVGQTHRARKLALGAISRAPDHPEGHEALAHVLLSEASFEPMLEAVERLMRLQPDSDRSHFLKAAALRGLGRFAEAERSLRDALAIDPSWPGYYKTYAQLLMTCDRHPEALRWTEAALRLDPDDASLHALRGALLLTVRPDNSVISDEAARHALRINPQDRTARTVLGWNHLQRGEREAAEAAFRSVLTEEPTHAAALDGLAQTVMSRHPLYRPLLWMSLRLLRLGPDGQLGAALGFWVLYGATVTTLNANPATQGWTGAISFVYLALVAWTWFAGPITYALLRRHHPWLPRPDV